MEKSNTPSSLYDDSDARLPAAAYLTYKNRADGWSPGRQAACLAHLADNGIAADAVRSVGMSAQGSYALRRSARGYAYNLGWEAALIIARRIVADDLMTAAIRGEQSVWLREEGKTTYTRQNTKMALTLLDRVNPATALPEVMAVATRFDCFLAMIDDGLSGEQLWDYFFQDALPHSDIEARNRVRAALQLTEESAAFDAEEVEEDAQVMEYKSMDGPSWQIGQRNSHDGTKPRRALPCEGTLPVRPSLAANSAYGQLRCAQVLRLPAFVSSCEPPSPLGKMPTLSPAGLCA